MDYIYKDKKELIKSFIKKTDMVLDVGFWGQGVTILDENWVHNLLKKNSQEVYGLDIDFDLEKLDGKEKYLKGSAENFVFPVKFDVIFAGDIIEHLSNPGLFLESCAKNLKDEGSLIITTPSCFNFFNLVEKITKKEPTVNKDHTCYFNYKTLKSLLDKNSWKMTEKVFLYALNVSTKESYKKKFLNFIYFLLSKFTNKFIETLVVVAKKERV